MVEAVFARMVAVFGSIVIDKLFDVTVSVPSETSTVILLVVPRMAVPVITPELEIDAQLGPLTSWYESESLSVSDALTEQLYALVSTPAPHDTVLIVGLLFSAMEIFELVTVS